jgi:hypothetical protein
MNIFRVVVERPVGLLTVFELDSTFSFTQHERPAHPVFPAASAARSDLGKLHRADPFEARSHDVFSLYSLDSCSILLDTDDPVSASYYSKLQHTCYPTSAIHILHDPFPPIPSISFHSLFESTPTIASSIGSISANSSDSSESVSGESDASADLFGPPVLSNLPQGTDTSTVTSRLYPMDFTANYRVLQPAPNIYWAGAVECF